MLVEGPAARNAGEVERQQADTAAIQHSLRLDLYIEHRVARDGSVRDPGRFLPAQDPVVAVAPRAELARGGDAHLGADHAEHVGAAVGLGHRPAAEHRSVVAGEVGRRELLDQLRIGRREGEVGVGRGEEDDAAQARVSPGQLLEHQVLARRGQGEASELARPAGTRVAELACLADHLEERRVRGHDGLRRQAVEFEAHRPQDLGRELAGRLADLSLFIREAEVVFEVGHASSPHASQRGRA